MGEKEGTGGGDGHSTIGGRVAIIGWGEGGAATAASGASMHCG